MKKIFILTGEPSGDKLASTVIKQIKQKENDIEFLSVGGSHLSSLGVESIFKLKDITYIGFTSVLLNIFKIRSKINETVNKIIEFNPDILFSVDSPDYTLRVAEKVKKVKPNIKTVHFVAPQVWIWRESRVKKLKKYLDHILLLFPFEKKYFDNENITNTFTGHPLLNQQDKNKAKFTDGNTENKKIISIYSGSRLSEIKILTPVLIDFIKLMNKKYHNLSFVFQTTKEYVDLLQKIINKSKLQNCIISFDEKDKFQFLKSSMFAVVKSGTVSLEIANEGVPSIIIYKMSMINFFIIKMLVKVKFANIINIAAKHEIIPELLQSKCNGKKIFKEVDRLLNNNTDLNEQIMKSQAVIKNFKNGDASKNACSVLLNYLYPVDNNNFIKR